MKEYDFLVIGGGMAGLAAAKRGADLGARVALAEKENLGGTWLNRGCIPKKALVRAMQVLKTIRQADEFGLSTGEVSFDWKAVLARKDRIVHALMGDKQRSLEERGIDYFHEGARFLSAADLELDGERVTAKKILIGTGSKTSKPPVEGIEKAITSTQALSLESLPKTLVMIGGGYIAIEFAHIFHTFDVDITVLEMEDRILKNNDAEAALELQRLMQEKGIKLHLSSKVKKIDGGIGNFTVTAQTPEGERQFQCEVVMNAAGRGANVEGLDIEKAGVEMTNKGIKVNEYLQTNVPHIYAAGDVLGRLMLTPVASYEAKLAAENALNGHRTKADYRVVPSAVFSDPELGAVGLTEEQIKEQGLKYKKVRYDLAKLGAAVLRGETEGFAKMIFEEESGRILGVHILGAEASELILEATFAMQGNLTQEEFGSTMLIHPSLSESLGAVTTTAQTGHKEGCCG